MKQTVRILSLILVLALFAAMAIGSGSGSSGSTKAPSSVSVSAGETESAASGTTEKSDAAEKSNTTEKSPAAEKPAAAPAVAVEETLLLDQDSITITAKGLDTKDSFGTSLKLLIENNSGRAVTVQARGASVNGYMIETLFSADVAPGKKANDTLTFMRSELETAGITTIADIEFCFHIFDSATWDTVLDSAPIKLNTSAAPGFPYAYDDSGDLVYQENGIEIVVKGLAEKDSWLGPEVVVYIHNTSGRDITVQARDVSINGFMVESVFSCDVVADKHALDTITFLSSDLKENGIEKIESVELSFHIFAMEGWDTIADTAPVTIQFS